MSVHSDLLELRTIQKAPDLVRSQAGYRRKFRIILVLSDALMLLAAFSLAYFLRFDLGITVSPQVPQSPGHYALLVGVLVLLWLPLFALLRLYDYQILLGGTEEYARAFNACTSGMMLVVLVSFIDESFIISRGWLLMSWFLSTLFVCTARLVLRRVVYRRWSKGHYLNPAIVVGTDAEARALAAKLAESETSGLTLLGFVETAEHPGFDAPARIDGFPVLGNMDSLTSLVQQSCVGEIIIASNSLNRSQLMHIFHLLIESPGTEVRLSSGLYEIMTSDMHVCRRGLVPLMGLSRLRLDPMETILKTVLDYSLILLAGPLLLITFAVIALLIRLDSKGPIFYRRRVVGVGGQEFDALKFRTMHVDGDAILARHPELEAELRANHKLKWDPRITRVGRFLRRTSLDELPQLINVLMGQMSLVGPRMISPAEVAEYGDMKLSLMSVKPGLTGMWQVSGRSDLSYDERVRLDMEYIRNYTIWLDLHILFFQTLPAVWRGRGAY